MTSTGTRVRSVPRALIGLGRIVIILSGCAADLSAARGQAAADHQPANAQPLDAQPLDARPLDARPVDARPVDARSAATGRDTPGTALIQPDAHLDTVVIEADRERAAVRRKVDAFVSAVAVVPVEDSSLKRWLTPVCPLVAGLPREQGEFILGRISQIAAAAGAPVAGKKCRGNLYVIVTSRPEELLKAWDRRDANVFGDAVRGRVRRFIGEAGPVRVWYNAVLEDRGGAPMSEFLGIPNGIPNNTHAENFRLSLDEVRNLIAVIVMVDANRATGVTFDQLAAYIAMTSLAELHLGAKMGEARSILQLFANPEKAPTDGLSSWDEAYLKALYTTRQEDKAQLGAIKTSIVRQIVP